MKIYTIGHSDHKKEEFLEMLHHAEINFIADVRAFPYSKKHPPDFITSKRGKRF